MQLFFLHIAKTAGTTLRSYLDGCFAPTSIYPGYIWPELLDWPLERLHEASFVRGHFYYGLIANLWRTPPVCVTMLRDPVERTLSAYGHLKTHADHPEHRRTASVALEDAVDDPWLSPHFLNAQTNMLTLRFEPVFPFDPMAVRASIRQQQGGADAKAAGRILASFAWVGITERFEESLLLLCYELGLPVPAGLGRENVNLSRPRSEELSSAEHEALLRVNAADLKLYEGASRRFDARYLAMCDDLLRRYAPASDGPDGLNLQAVARLVDQHLKRSAKDAAVQDV